MTYKHLNIERDGHLAIVKFNRPETANSLSYDHLNEIEHCAFSFREDAKTRVVIFTGEGKHFSSGADITEMEKNNDAPIILQRRKLRMGERVLKAILSIDQITIVAWNGGAIGGGACLATAADFRIGTNESFMHYPEIELGLNLMWQSLPLTIRLVGPTRAKRLVIGAEKVFSDKLLSWGLLESVVPQNQLIRSCIDFAQDYISKSPIAAQMIKRSINNICGVLDQGLMHMDADQHLFVAKTSDQQIAKNMYLNKGNPDFTGN
jgi:enoyl-CoA hydratase/carnithine racemase